MTKTYLLPFPSQKQRPNYPTKISPPSFSNKTAIKPIRRRRGQTRGATVEDGEVLIVSSVREPRGLSGIGVLLWARGVPEVGEGEGHGSGGLVEQEDSVTQ